MMRTTILSLLLALACVAAHQAGLAPAAAADWFMPGANPQRTGWIETRIPGNLAPVWYRPIEPYISQNTQLVAVAGRLYVATARGLYCLRADDGELLWIYPTELPLGQAPTVVDGVAYVAGFDRKLHAVDAASGRPLWTFDDALAGYRTNPLVAENKVFLGARDGAFYAVHAHGHPQAGTLAWKFAAGGPILYSAAYHAGRVYFAAQDLHGYCLDAATGAVHWRTERFGHTAGFHSIWPVVWADKGMVVFCGNTPNYRGNARPGTRSIGNHNFGHYHEVEKAAIYGDAPRGLAGESGDAPGDWAAGTTTVDMARGVEYLQQFPHRRTVLVVDLETGREFTFEHQGRPAYAPFLLWGTKQQGPRAAPAIGRDGVLYQTSHYLASGTFGRGQVVGWTLGARHLSIPNPRKHNAFDEPLAFALGGDLVYWSLCCDREMGSFALAGAGAWQWCNYNLPRLAPGYDEMWAAVGDQDGTGNRLWGAYGSNNGVYHNHTADQNPPIPHGELVFLHRSNAVFAWGPRRAAPARKLPLARAPAAIAADESTHRPLAEVEIRRRLADEVRKMLDAGPLRTGYFDGGQHWSRPIWGDNLNEYFTHPGDTVWALLRVLPLLPPELREPVREYVRDWQRRFPLESIAHIGWRDGAGREAFDLPPEVAADLVNFGPQPLSRCQFWRFPPQQLYALARYAEEFGDAERLLHASRDKLAAPCPVGDAALAEFAYIHNAYIAGYLGYLKLEQLAGRPETAAMRAELDRLLKLRAENFQHDTPWTSTNRGSHVKRMSVFRNYLYLTPELGAYLHEHARDKVARALDQIDADAPYWFVTHYEGCLQESNIQNLHDYHSVYQARAWALREPRARLDRHLDVPSFARGDLHYLHQLASWLEAEE